MCKGSPGSLLKYGWWLVVALGLGYGAMIVAHGFWPQFYLPWIPASVSVLLLLAFLTAALGAVTYLAGARKRWLFPVLGALVLIAVAFPKKQVEDRFPNLVDVKTGKDYYDERRKLVDYSTLRSTNPAGLADDLETLKTWHGRMKEVFDSHQPIFIVTCSGGFWCCAFTPPTSCSRTRNSFPVFPNASASSPARPAGCLGPPIT